MRTRIVSLLGLTAVIACFLVLTRPPVPLPNPASAADRSHASIANPVSLGPPPRVITAQLSNDADAVLTDFQQWADTYVRAVPQQRAQLLPRGIQLALERRAALAALIPADPRKALRWEVSVSVRRQLPAEVLGRLEERVAGRGAMAVIAQLPAPGVADAGPPVSRFVQVNGRTYRAYVYGRRLQQPTTRNLPLHGIAIDDVLAVHEDPVRPREWAGAADPEFDGSLADPICGVSGLPGAPTLGADVGEETKFFCTASHIAAYNRQLTEQENSWSQAAVASGWTTGTKSVLFMRVNFPDYPVESISASSAASMMNAASNYFRAVSYGATGLRAVVTPILTLPRTKASYQAGGNGVSVLEDARVVARNMGYDPDQYDLDCVHMPFMFGNWTGTAFVGAKGTMLQATHDAGVAIHEFGHNFGLMHANAWVGDNDSIIGSTGDHWEYGNPYDQMGNMFGNARHFNVYEKNLLGWIPDAQVATVTNSGTFRVHAFDVPALGSNLVHAIRIPKDVRSYWLEHRALFTSRWVTNGILVNWSPWSRSQGGSHLLDLTPGTAFGLEDSPLILGRTLSDPFLGLHITPVRRNATTPASIDVVVNVGTFPGNRAPSISIAASSTAPAAGAPVILTAAGSDPDGDELVYCWDFDSPWAPESFASGSVVTNQFAGGEYNVRCTVSDMKGGTSSANLLVRSGTPFLYRISGRVMNGAMPVEGVRVFGGPKPAYTDANGEYAVTEASSTQYYLSAAKRGWTFTRQFTNPVVLNGSVSNINFTAAVETYLVSGRVIDGPGAVAGVAMTLGTNSTLTAADGSYVFTNLAPGRYLLSADKPDHEFVVFNNGTVWDNPVLVEWGNATNLNYWRPRYVISGMVSNLAEQPIVTIGDPNEQPFGEFYQGRWYYGLRVPRGTWNMTATRPGYTIVPLSFTNPITITDTIFRSFDFVAVPGNSYSISGQVREAGRPVPGAVITAGGKSGFSDTAGNYLIPALSNGAYTVNIARPDYVFTPGARSVTLAGNNAAAQDFFGRLMFRLADPQATENGLEFTLLGGSNRIFQIESASHLTAWTTRATVTNHTGATPVRMPPSDSAVQFYRAWLKP